MTPDEILEQALLAEQGDIFLFKYNWEAEKSQLYIGIFNRIETEEDGYKNVYNKLVFNAEPKSEVTARIQYELASQFTNLAGLSHFELFKRVRPTQVYKESSESIDDDILI